MGWLSVLKKEKEKRLSYPISSMVKSIKNVSLQNKTNAKRRLGKVSQLQIETEEKQEWKQKQWRSAAKPLRCWPSSVNFCPPLHKTK